MSKMSELRDAVEGILEDEGVPRPYDFGVANNAHQQVTFHVKGVRVKYQFACSPSGQNSERNSRRDLRRCIRSAEGRAVPTAPQGGPVLDGGGVLPRKPDHVGAGRARAHQHASTLPHSRGVLQGQAR